VLGCTPTRHQAARSGHRIPWRPRRGLPHLVPTLLHQPMPSSAPISSSVAGPGARALAYSGQHAVVASYQRRRRASMSISCCRRSLSLMESTRSPIGAPPDEYPACPHRPDSNSPAQTTLRVTLDSSTGPRSKSMTSTWNSRSQRELTVNQLSGKLGADHPESEDHEGVERGEGREAEPAGRIGGAVHGGAADLATPLSSGTGRTPELSSATQQTAVRREHARPTRPAQPVAAGSPVPVKT
jgi:hypothetical protein